MFEKNGSSARPGRVHIANVTFRGGGLPDEHRSFFTVGKKYRTTRFVATSFRRSVAERFVSRRPDPAVNKAILWTVRFHPTGRCMHVNYLQDLSALDESELLFPPYSVKLVRSGFLRIFFSGAGLAESMRSHSCDLWT